MVYMRRIDWNELTMRRTDRRRIEWRRIVLVPHHKHKREHLSTSSYQSDEIDTLNIEQIIGSAYDQAKKSSNTQEYFIR